MQPSKLERKLLHYASKANAHYHLIEKGDRVLVCLSGGKDSFTMVNILERMRVLSNYKFSMQVLTLDQGQPGWDDAKLRAWLEERNIPFAIVKEDTYSIVVDKVPENKTYCSLCSRLRRGIIYSYAKEHGFTKIALGHHRDDTITSLLMSIFYNGQIQAMPPKLLSDDKANIIIRPLIYCQEQDIIAYAKEQKFPIIPCNLCGTQTNLQRQEIGKLIRELAQGNPKIPSNILHALQSVQPSQLMDKNLMDFQSLASEVIDNS